MRCTVRGSFLGNQNKVCEKKEIYSVNRFNDVLLLIKSPHSGKPVWLRELFIFIFSSCTPFHRVSTLSIMILLSERVLTTKASHYKPRHVGVKFWKRTLFMKIKISKKLGIKKDSKARVNCSIEHKRHEQMLPDVYLCPCTNFHLDLTGVTSLDLIMY